MAANKLTLYENKGSLINMLLQLLTHTGTVFLNFLTVFKKSLQAFLVVW